MKRERVKIVITGHVDHGKSTLIGRLLLDTGSLPTGQLSEIRKISRSLGRGLELAYLTDQFKEEREQERTIDTTQRILRSRSREYVLIDAPGHREFIRNMVTGASMASAGILVVDALARSGEETLRHVYLIKLLGIDRLIVAVNKMDLLGYNRDAFENLKNELSDLLKGAGVRAMHTIPLSAKEGVNVFRKDTRRMGWYRGVTLLGAMDSLSLPSDLKNRPLRLPVQDVYETERGRLAAGRIESGKIRKGENLLVLPSGRKMRARAIRIFDKPRRNTAGAGESIGVVLDKGIDVSRGDIITHIGLAPEPTVRFKGNIFWMAAQPLRIGQRFNLRCFTQEAPCAAERIENRLNTVTLEIIERESQVVTLNEAAEVTFALQRPLVVERHSVTGALGRFILESGDRVAGMGVVI